MANLRGTVLFVPLEEATTPHEGHCYVNKWWTVHPEKGVAFYAVLRGYLASEEPAPQCNPDQSTARRLTARLHPDCEVRFLSAVYAGPAKQAMRKARAALTPKEKNDD